MRKRTTWRFERMHPLVQAFVFVVGTIAFLKIVRLAIIMLYVVVTP